MKKLLIWLKARLQEPSSYPAVFLFLTFLGVSVRPDLQEAITEFGLSLAALLMFVKREPGKQQHELRALGKE